MSSDGKVCSSRNTAPASWHENHCRLVDGPGIWLLMVIQLFFKWCMVIKLNRKHHFQKKTHPKWNLRFYYFRIAKSWNVICKAADATFLFTWDKWSWVFIFFSNMPRYVPLANNVLGSMGDFNQESDFGHLIMLFSFIPGRWHCAWWISLNQICKLFSDFYQVVHEGKYKIKSSWISHHEVSRDL